MPRWTKGLVLIVVGALLVAAVVNPSFFSGEGEANLGDLPAASDTEPATGAVPAAFDAPADDATASSEAAAEPTPPAVVLELFDRIEGDPADVDAWKQLAEMLIESGDHMRASEAYAAAVEADPQDGEARAGLGKALLFQGLVRVARAELIRAIELDPDNPEARLNLGITYSHSAPANLTAARAEWTAVVELVPDTELATAAQQYLDTYSEAAAAQSDQTSATP